jgi:hypothetical protein
MHVANSVISGHLGRHPTAIDLKRLARNKATQLIAGQKQVRANAFLRPRGSTEWGKGNLPCTLSFQIAKSACPRPYIAFFDCGHHFASYDFLLQDAISWRLINIPSQNTLVLFSNPLYSHADSNSLPYDTPGPTRSSVSRASALGH